MGVLLVVVWDWGLAICYHAVVVAKVLGDVKVAVTQEANCCPNAVTQEANGCRNNENVVTATKTWLRSDLSMTTKMSATGTKRAIVVFVYALGIELF